MELKVLREGQQADTHKRVLIFSLQLPSHLLDKFVPTFHAIFFSPHAQQVKCGTPEHYEALVSASYGWVIVEELQYW